MADLEGESSGSGKYSNAHVEGTDNPDKSMDSGSFSFPRLLTGKLWGRSIGVRRNPWPGCDPWPALKMWRQRAHCFGCIDAVEVMRDFPEPPVSGIEVLLLLLTTNGLVVEDAALTDGRFFGGREPKLGDC